MITEILDNIIKGALMAIGVEDEKVGKIELEHPEEFANGDYSSNIAMVLAKKLAQNPRELAGKLVEKINTQKPSEIEKVEVAGPGFINFYLSSKFFEGKTKEIIKFGEKFGQNKNLNNQKVVVEYTDPNPFKEFHIGHLMSNAIGESVSRIIEANGAKVLRACYQGDVGLHVAKTIWGVRKMLAEDPNAKKKFFGSFLNLSKDTLIWGQAYALGAKNYEASDVAKAEIVKINKSIYLKDNIEINKIYKVGRKVSLIGFEKIYKILDTKFNKYFFESQTTDFGTKIVLENLEKGIFEKSNGAVIFKGENYGLHTRVFINSEGLPTYEAKDLGLAKFKYDSCHYEKSIIITANEQSDYFKVLLKAMSFIFPDLASKTFHVSHGMLRLPEGKMSSRTGDVITAISLIEKIKVEVAKKIFDRDMKDSEKEKVTEKVAVGALKYSILKQVTGKDIIFDFDKSISFEGDSGPYLQYSYARAKSILRKAKEEKIKADFKKPNSNISELEKNLYKFPEIVERAGKDYSPSHIATYLIETASAFNNFYAEGKIVNKEDLNSPYKIALTEAFSIVMENGLKLLGIKVMEKM
ncbi:MAG: arginine--tRNA ligase [Minisyncoccia bacterium]